ncbi:hypothetical protein chiPu_0004891 [Chiloscyllium punctatum]|uniref:Secreted protein n=1 Tax=Chiloscyllium punctatum TaxID=137246 RepID=A0A401S7U5_CHIPU|nr:hypothetical protein [Chiloscyllium punctatum]
MQGGVGICSGFSFTMLGSSAGRCCCCCYTRYWGRSPLPFGRTDPRHCPPSAHLPSFTRVGCLLRWWGRELLLRAPGSEPLQHRLCRVTNTSGRSQLPSAAQRGGQACSKSPRSDHTGPPSSPRHSHPNPLRVQ